MRQTKSIKSDETDELIQDFVNMVRQLKQYQAKKTDHPFSFVQMQVMWFLFENKESGKDHPTMSELAGILKVKLATCSQLIERLVEIGFVKREHDKKDRRIVRVILTGEGLSELNRMKEENLSRLKKFLGYISKDDLKVLKRVIGQISGRIK